ncbi:hypothetical protein V8F33_010695 [Rhypophila sp. PSN 637]
MPRVRLPISRIRPPPLTLSPPAAAPEPNAWDPVPKPTSGTFVPDGNAIYHGSSGFELLKSLPIISATIEFLDCGPLPVAAAAAAAPPPPLPPPPAPPTISFTPINPRPPVLVVTGPSSPSPSGCSSCRGTPSPSSEDDDDNDDEEAEDEDPSPSYAESADPDTSRKRKRFAHGQKGRPHRNHVVLRFRTKEAVPFSLPGGRDIPACNGVICSVEESTSSDDRCFFAMKPIAYDGVSRSASAAFKFDVLGGEGPDFTLRDVLRVCEEGNLLPFKYAVQGMDKSGRPMGVGCRDWMTQLFCRLHQAGYLGWHTTTTYPESLTTKGFPTGTTTFAQIISHRYSGVRRPGKRICARLPYVEPSPVVPGHFAQETGAEEIKVKTNDEDDDRKGKKKDKSKSKSKKRKRDEPDPAAAAKDADEGTSTTTKKIRWLKYNGEELGYQIQPQVQPEDGDRGRGTQLNPEAPVTRRRSPRLARLAAGE